MVDDPVALFVAALSEVHGEGFFNPWREWDPDMDMWSIPAPMMRRERLIRHLSIYPALILVGEAPGYQGCRYSGVPFTSERLIIEGQIPRVSELHHWPRVEFGDRIHHAEVERITTRDKPWSEPSATIVWKALHDLRIADTTVMWNAFPFHPYRPGFPLSNATPTVEQLLNGREWLARLLQLPNLRNAEVLPIGKKAAAMLEGVRQFPVTLRHPANGGAKLFREQLAAYVKQAR